MYVCVSGREEGNVYLMMKVFSGACVCVCVCRSSAYDERVMGPMTTGGDQPDPSFVCERVCTSDRLLKRLGGVAKVRALI